MLKNASADTSIIKEKKTNVNLKVNIINYEYKMYKPNLP